MIEPGQIWRSVNRGHTPQTYRVVRCNGRTVQLFNISRGQKQHRHRVYTLPVGTLLSLHERLR